MGRKIKVYNISDDNKKFIDTYEEHIVNKCTWASYKMVCCQYLEFLGDTEMVKAKPEQFSEFLENLTPLEKSILKSFYKFVIGENIGNGKFFINKKILLDLL